MWKRIRPYFIISLTLLLSTFILWLPFLFRFTKLGYFNFSTPLSMLEVYKHWDGVLYIIPAKSWYIPALTELPGGGFVLSLPLSPGYFAAHFPFYPLLIRLAAPLVGYLKAMLAWPVIFALFLAWLFYYVCQKYKLSKKPLLLTLVLLFFTPRFFVIRSVGAPETIFMFLLLVSIYFFMEKKYWLAGLIGALAVTTKSPGMLLVPAYGLFFLEEFIRTRKFNFNWLSILVIPLGLVAVFTLYYFSYGDFFAYFKSGDNIHLLFPPFQVFDATANWIGSGWLEDIMFIFIFYLAVLFNLWENKKLRPAFYFVLVYFLAIISVQHKDIARYSLPMLPFALVAFEKLFTSKKFIFALIILLPALYFYAWNFMLHNIAPINDWSVFM